MSSIRRPRPRLRRPVVVATVIAAALALTATACQSGGSDTNAEAKPSAKPSSNEDLGIPKELPKDLPTSLQDLDKWRNGAWKNWDRDQWVREASDFVNPYIKDHWKPDRMDKAEDNGKRVPENVESASGASATGPEPRAVKARNVEDAVHEERRSRRQGLHGHPRGPDGLLRHRGQGPAQPGQVQPRRGPPGTVCTRARAAAGTATSCSCPRTTTAACPRPQLQNAQPQDVAPYGQWWGDWAQTTRLVDQGAARSRAAAGAPYDFAVLHVKPEQRTGKSLEETVGAAVKIDFNGSAHRELLGASAACGYPAAPPYNGAKMYSCTDKPGASVDRLVAARRCTASAAR